MVYLMMFGLLGATSVIVFDPVTTLAEVIEDEGPVDELIRIALPMTFIFALATVVAISVPFGGEGPTSDRYSSRLVFSCYSSASWTYLETPRIS